MDIVPWISAITALAGMVKAYAEAVTAGLKREEAVRQAERARLAESSRRAKYPEDLIISEHVLQAYVQDIAAAEERFVEAIKDTGRTEAQISDAQQQAIEAICRHLSEIRRLNGGILPVGQLERLWRSYRCPASP